MFGLITKTLEFFFQNRLLEIARRCINRPLIKTMESSFKWQQILTYTKPMMIMHSLHMSQLTINTVCSSDTGQSGAPSETCCKTKPKDENIAAHLQK